MVASARTLFSQGGPHWLLDLLRVWTSHLCVECQWATKVF